MAIAITTEKNALADKYALDAPYAALFTADPGTTGSATNEVSGGTYARVAIAWGSSSGGVVVGTATLNVPAGTTVTYAGVCASGTATTADLKDKVAVTSQTFATAGSYALTLTFTLS